MRTLLRPCLGCGTSVRGKPRCADCQRAHDRAKAKRRPDLHADAHERARRRRVVADHRARVGDWCPGVPELRRGAHPSADLTADHLVEVAAGGLVSGPLVVRCRSCNSARSAWLATGVGPLVAAAAATPLPPHFPTLFETTVGHVDPPHDDGPSVA
jgi:5-methylcytosine-specific restriction protein A